MKVRIVKYFRREWNSNGGTYIYGVEVKKHWYSTWTEVYNSYELELCQREVDKIFYNKNKQVLFIWKI